MGIQQGSQARHRQGRGALAGEAGEGGGAGLAEEGEGGMWPWPSGWVASSLPEGGEGGEGD